jgi:hypothetical protein
MTDRELLELAAKAVGYSWVRGFSQDGAWWHQDPENARRWNPLTDDADMTPLIVRLGIKVLPYPVFGHEKHSVIASRRLWSPPEDDDNSCYGPECLEQYGDDPAAATRRAVVRVAAEIGQEMP